jgi:hypothetical protein
VPEAVFEASDKGMHLMKPSALRDRSDGKLRLAEHVTRLIQALLPQPTTKAHAVSLLKNPPETAYRQPRTTRALAQKPIGCKILLRPFDRGPQSLVAPSETIRGSQHEHPSDGPVELGEKPRWLPDRGELCEELSFQSIALLRQNQPQTL